MIVQEEFEHRPLHGVQSQCLFQRQLMPSQASGFQPSQPSAPASQLVLLQLVPVLAKDRIISSLFHVSIYPSIDRCVYLFSIYLSINWIRSKSSKKKYIYIYVYMALVYVYIYICPDTLVFWAFLPDGIAPKI